MYLSDYEGGQGEQLDGFFKSASKAFKKIDKTVRKLTPAPIRNLGHSIVTAAKKTDSQIKNEIARSKYAQGVIYAAGIVAAPWTGGYSLAASAALVQGSKAKKAGRSFGAQALQAAGAFGIGWVAGQGLVWGATQAGVGPGALQASQAASAAASDAGMLYAPAGSTIATAGAPAASTGWGFASGLKTATAGLNTVKDIFGVVALSKALMGQKGGAPGGDAPALFDTSQQGNAPQSIYSSGYAGGSGYSESSGGGGGGSSSGQGVSSELGPVADVVNSKTSLYVAGGVVALLAIAAAMKGRKSRRR